MADEKLVAKISADSTQLKGELDGAKAKVKELRDASKETTDKGAEDWKKLGGAILQAGSSVAIIAKGVQSLIQIFKQLSQAATDAVLRMAKLTTGNQSEASQGNYQRATAAQEALRKYYDLAQKAATGTNEDEERRRQAERDFNRRYGNYGIDLGAADLKEEISRGLELTQARRLEALKAEIDSYVSANKKLTERQNKLTDLQKSEVEALQAAKDANEARIRELIKLKSEAERQTPVQDFRGMARAREWDAEDRAQAEAAAETEKQRLAELENQRKQTIAAQKNYLAALNQYSTALKAEQQAVRELADTKRQLAREQRAEALEQRRERLQKRLAQFGFSVFDGFSVNETGRERAARRRTYRLDASIAEKMAAQETGERVHYSTAERRRIAEYQSLSGRDKAAEAAQRQMQAADRQRQAAETMRRAANAFREATAGRRAGAQTYSAALTLLHNDLVKLYNDTYRVR